MMETITESCKVEPAEKFLKTGDSYINAKFSCAFKISIIIIGTYKMPAKISNIS